MSNKAKLGSILFPSVVVMANIHSSKVDRLGGSGLRAWPVGAGYTDDSVICFTN